MFDEMFSPQFKARFTSRELHCKFPPGTCGETSQVIKLPLRFGRKVIVRCDGSKTGKCLLLNPKILQQIFLLLW